MRPRNETRKRSARCPECGQHFSPQGLNGHLRFHHAKGMETVKTAQKEAVISGGIAERARLTMELVRQLREVREQKAELQGGNDEEGFFSEPDDAISDALAALTLSENELRGELRKAAGRGELAEKKPSFLDQLFGGDDEDDSDDDDDSLTDDDESGEEKKAAKSKPKPKQKAKAKSDDDDDDFFA